MIPIRLNEVLRAMLLMILLIMILSMATLSKENVTSNAYSNSAEKTVAYLCRPSVALITNYYTGGLFSRYTGTQEVWIYTTPNLKFTLPSFVTGGTGSGFIISSNGYIATNAHVVHTSDEEIKSDFALQAVDYVASQWPDVAAAAGCSQLHPTEDNLSFLYKLFTSDEYKLQYKQETLVYFGTPSGSVLNPQGHPAEIRKISSEDLWSTSGDEVYRSGKDLAIIKVEGVRDLPVAILGDSDNIEVGDKVIAIGYPGTAISGTEGVENVRLSPETNLVPTVTSGIVSAIRELPDGSDVIQSDVTVFHGNSGGPAFDENGKVIGVTTFGAGKKLSSGEWLDIQGYNFIIPINVAKSFISELNINTTPSETTKSFEKGLGDYWNGKYSDALSEFNKILVNDPNNNYASDYARMSMNPRR